MCTFWKFNNEYLLDDNINKHQLRQIKNGWLINNQLLKLNSIIKSKQQDSNMLKLNIACPDHKLPYQFLVISQSSQKHLRCRQCPYDESCLRISSQIQFMKNRMCSEKAKQRQKSRSRSKSKSKKSVKHDEDDEIDVTQRVAEEQVIILETAMKLLTEDKNKYLQQLEKAVAEHKKLWKQYSQSTNQVLFLNKMIGKNCLKPYMWVLNKQGWNDFKKLLKNVFTRGFISKKIRQQSDTLFNQAKNSSKIGQQSVLRSLEILLNANNSKKSQKQSKESQKQSQKTERSEKKNKRSKSFAK